jgi:hypothetical protein
MTTTTETPTLTQLLADVGKAEAALNAYLEEHNYQVLEVKGFVYAVHPDYVQKFRANYNPRVGGWFGAGKGTPAHAVVPL